MLASMIFQKEPFFHGQDNYDQVPLTLDQAEHNGSSARCSNLPVIRSLLCVIYSVVGADRQGVGD